MKGLVHICCAPDSILFLEKLKNDFKDYQWIGYFYDPNIHPRSEYELRFIETKRVCDRLGIPLIEGPYDDDIWLSYVHGLEKEPEKGKRCEVCFDIRLKNTFEFAKEINANIITTTLLMSPKKSMNQINLVASSMSKEYGIDFLPVDYRKGGGVQKMHEMVKEYEIYSQDYCGCIYGLFNQKPDIEMYMWSKVTPGSVEELLFIKRMRLLGESMGLIAKEINFDFIGWDLLQGYIYTDDEPIPSYIRYYSKSTNGIAKTKIDFEKDNTLYLTKQNIKVVFSFDIPPYPDPSTCFIVDDIYKEKLINDSKIKAYVKSSISYKSSSILLLSRKPLKDVSCIKAYKTYKDYFEPINFDIIDFDIDEDKAIAIVGAYDMGGYHKLLEHTNGKEIFDNSGSLCNRIL